MEKVNFHPTVKRKLLNLIEFLFEENYFAFKESALEYVDNLEKFVYSIPEQK